MAQSPVQVGVTADGACLVRVVGRATMQHSPATQELIVQLLERNAEAVALVDLTDCTYLDSTFLGCLFGLHRRFVQSLPPGAAPRLKFHAPLARMKQLFGPLRLDRIMRAEIEAAPPPHGPMEALEPGPADLKEIARHVMECHRRLAQADTPAKEAFARIAEAMEQEIAGG